jgi:energy-coupling factor transporter ATP-binding protein EcfA2
MIDITGLVKRFGRFVAVDGLDLDVPPGTVHGFLGPNGAGKSTTIRVLLGLYRATAGRVRVLGLDPAGGPAPGPDGRAGGAGRPPDRGDLLGVPAGIQRLGVFEHVPDLTADTDPRTGALALLAAIGAGLGWLGAAVAGRRDIVTR